jgi:hypothetical protein
MAMTSNAFDIDERAPGFANKLPAENIHLNRGR